MIAPPKCQKSFGRAACQTDHIVLTATPANGRNKNCFWADIVLRAPISLVDTPDSNEDMVSPHSDFNHFRSHILKYDPIVFSLCWCWSASKANIVCHNSNYVECFLKYMLRKGLIFTFTQRRCKVLAGVIVRSPVKLSGNPRGKHHKSNLSSFCAVQDDTVTQNTLRSCLWFAAHCTEVALCKATLTFSLDFSTAEIKQSEQPKWGKPSPELVRITVEISSCWVMALLVSLSALLVKCYV